MGGEVIHVITERLEDLSDLLRSAGDRDEAFAIQSINVEATRLEVASLLVAATSSTGLCPRSHGRPSQKRDERSWLRRSTMRALNTGRKPRGYFGLLAARDQRSLIGFNPGGRA